VTLAGRPVTRLVFAGTALWDRALRAQPVRCVVVRDPAGRRKDEAFFCTDRAVGAAVILSTDAERWALEVAFFEMKQSLGFEDPQNQTAPAARRTAPFVGLVHALIVLWAARRVQDGAAPVWPERPWSRRKAAPSFPDLLAAFRQASATRPAPPPDARRLSVAPCPTRHRRNTHRRRHAPTSAPA
jgi:hypothetical protein